MKLPKFGVIGKMRRMALPGKMILSMMALSLLLSMNSCTTLSVTRGVGMEENFDQPYWAPYCENPALVRYYYFPDIECYYDVRHRDFIYMVDGEWMFGRILPRTYGWFDLDNCFVVALNTSVYEPWRHFNYYVSHYPRYYYRTIYGDRYRDREHPMRGFNENERNVVYNHRPDWDNNKIDRKRDDRNDYNRPNDNRANTVIKENNNRNENRSNNTIKESNSRNENRSSKTVKESNSRNENRSNIETKENNSRNNNRSNTEVKDNNGKVENKSTNEPKREFPERRVEPTKEPLPVKYNPKEVGRPVKVQRNMKNLEETKTRTDKEVKQEKEYRKK